MVDFSKVINTISSITPNFIYDTFKVKALNKELLCVFLPGSSNSILLYDENCGLNNVGEIRYVIRDGKCFVSTFETDKNFQQMGIGRFMFNMALAHADAVGAKTAYGYPNPTNEIMGVSSGEEDMFEKEKQTLLKIYEKLGCKVENISINENAVMEKKFEICWNHGERYGALSKKQQQFVKRVVTLEKQQNK